MASLIHALLRFPFLTTGAVLSSFLIAGLAFSILNDRKREREISKLVIRSRNHSGRGIGEKTVSNPSTDAEPGGAQGLLRSLLSRAFGWKFVLPVILGAALVLALANGKKPSLTVQARTAPVALRQAGIADKTNLLARTRDVGLSERGVTSPWTASLPSLGRTRTPAPSQPADASSSIVISDPARPLTDTTLPPDVNWGVLRTIHAKEVSVPARLQRQPLFVKSPMP